MKLVDILARELKIWPEGLGDIVGQAADGTLHSENDVGPILRTYMAYTECDHWVADIVTRSQWQAAVDALKAEAAPAWVGVGLPPVGIDVEVLFDSLPIKYVGCKILAHDEDRAVYRFTTGPRKGEYGSDLANFIGGSRIDMFRPIRTPEQIAADVARYQWLVSIEASYGKEAADKCESILIEADNRKQAAQ